MTNEMTTSSLTAAELDAQIGEPLPTRSLMSLLGGSTGTLGLANPGDGLSMPANPPQDPGADYANAFQYDLFKRYA